MTAICPTEEELSDFLFGKAEVHEFEAIREHVEHCANCEARIEKLEVKQDTLIRSLLRLASQRASDLEPSLQRALMLSKEEAIERSASRGGTDNPKSDTGHRSHLAKEVKLPDGYEAPELLGAGGMGTVYRAWQTHLDRFVAIKVVSPTKIGDAATLSRFRREMKVVGKLDHPNIVRAYEAREVDGQPYLIMEFVDGIDLAKLLKKSGPLRVADACELIRQAAKGLQHAYEHGLVHRDIKPSNLILCRTGRVKLLDLGLARLVQQDIDDDGLTKSGQVLGTIDYMAPEQAGESRAAEIQADIYSLGATLYCLLTGHAPFRTPEHGSWLQRILALANTPAPSIENARKDLPPAAVTLIHCLLSKNPRERPESPAELAAALQPLAAGSDLRGLAAIASESREPRDAVALDASDEEDMVYHSQPNVSPQQFLVETDSGKRGATDVTPARRKFDFSLNAWGMQLRIAIAFSLLLLVIPLGVILHWRRTSAVLNNATPPENFSFPRPHEQPIAPPQREQPTDPPQREQPTDPPQREQPTDPPQREQPTDPPQREQPTDPPQREQPTDPPQPDNGNPARSEEIESLDAKWRTRLAWQFELPTGVPYWESAGSVDLRGRMFTAPAGEAPWVMRGVELPADLPDFAEVVERPAQKLAIPDSDVQKPVRQKLDELYNIAGLKTPEEKLAAAKNLLDVAREPSDKPDERYVMLATSAQLAADSGDLLTALLAVETIDIDYDGDASAMKLHLARLFAKSNVPATVKSQQLAEVLPIIDEALVNDHFTAIDDLVKDLLAAKLRHPELAGRRKIALDMQDTYRKVTAARKTLQSSPDDPTANRVVGEYYCYYKLDWEQGLPYLTKADDAAIQKAAERDASSPESATDQLAVADGWFNLSKDVDPKTNERQKGSLLARAQEWYERAATDLKGLDEAHAKKRLDEVETELVKLGWVDIPRKAVIVAASGLSFDCYLNGERLFSGSYGAESAEATLKRGDTLVFHATKSSSSQGSYSKGFACVIVYEGAQPVATGLSKGWEGFVPSDRVNWYRPDSARSGTPVIASSGVGHQDLLQQTGVGARSLWYAAGNTSEAYFVYRVR